MRKWYKLISCLLILTFIAAGLQPMRAYAKENPQTPAASQNISSQNVSTKNASTQNTPTQNPITQNNHITGGSNYIDKAKRYPYLKLEEPATVEGFEYKLKDNVKFLPDSSNYNLVPAPTEAPPQEGEINSMALAPQVPAQEKTYKPGTNLMKFSDASFVPDKDTIYIDKNVQGSFKVIDDADVVGGKVEAAVVSPRADEVFSGLYIPRQEIDLTKGNITDLAEGVELVDNTQTIRSFSGTDQYPLPAADTSREYHEFILPGYTIYEYPEKEDKDDEELPKGKEENSGPTPSPTPHPEDRDAKDTGASSMAIKIRLQGGRIRVYEPSLVADLNWYGNFDLGFRSMKVESNIVLEGNITFSKEVCMRIYGYGVDFGSGDISAHIGIGIYAVFGVNGNITLTARVESVGTVKGGVTGNLFAAALGVPAAVPYASYDSEKFDVSLKLNAKIHAWAYVGPQVTIDILDFNLLTLQVWVGMEGDAVVKAEASTNGPETFQMDLSLDFVVLFKAWLCDYSYEKYLVKKNIYKNTFQYTSGQNVSSETAAEKHIVPSIKVDGCCSYYDMVWGELYYTDTFGGISPVKNLNVNIIVTRNGTATTYTRSTDSDGKFSCQVPGGLKPQDTVMISSHYSRKEDNQTVYYDSDLAQIIHPTIPFTIYMKEADGFNDQVIGTVSPANPVPGHPDGGAFNGKVTVYIVDKDGNTIRTKQVTPVNDEFTVRYSNTMDLSGGHIAFARLTFEGVTIESDHMESNLEALKMNIACRIDGTDAADVSEYIMTRDNKYPTFGVKVQQAETSGTITNLHKKKAYSGNVDIIIKTAATAFVKTVPVEVGSVDLSIKSMAVPNVNIGPDLSDIQIPMSSVSTFEEILGKETLGPMGCLVTGVGFKIEYEGMEKSVFIRLSKTDTESEAETSANPIDQIMTDVVDSRVNWPDVCISIGSSQMQVNGILRDIDGGSNTSVQMIQGVLYVPAKAVTEALGGTFNYNAKTKNMSINLNSITLNASNGKKSIKLGGKSTAIAAAPILSETGVVMIPATLLADKLGYKTTWDQATGTLSIIKPEETTSKGETDKETSEKDDSEKDTSGDTDSNESEESLQGSWSGVWDTELGTLILNQKDNKVTGSYGMSESIYQLSGTVKDDKLTGKFTEGAATGSFEFTLSEEEEAFKGRFRYDGGEWSDWSGTKITSKYGSKNTDWGGVWYTDLGSMIFDQSGSEVTGIYGENNYKITGTVSGLKFTGEFTYEGKDGEVQITFNKGKRSFEGKYQLEDEEGFTYFFGYKIN